MSLLTILCSPEEAEYRLTKEAAPGRSSPNKMSAKFCTLYPLPTDSEPSQCLTENKMKPRQQSRDNHRQLLQKAPVFCLFLLTLILSPLAAAKKGVDFDPGLDFSKYKSF